MKEKELRQFFQLDKHNEIFRQALTPRSCGGDAKFEQLAMIGDKILGLGLIQFYIDGGIITKGDITTLSQLIHQEPVLREVGEKWEINQFMIPIDSNHQLSSKEIAEEVEALLGATYEIHGVEACQKIVEEITKMAAQQILIQPQSQDSHKDLLPTVNYKGLLLEQFQKLGTSLPDLGAKPAGGSPHMPRFQSRGTLLIEGKEFQYASKIFSNKKDAEQDAARQLLEQMGTIVLTPTPFLPVSTPSPSLLEKSSSTQEKRIYPTQSIQDQQLIFEKQAALNISSLSPSQPGIIVSKNTGELLSEWTVRKARKKPFGIFLLLSGKLEEVSGSAWTCKLPIGYLVIQSTTVIGKTYFGMGFAESKNQAKKAAGRHLLETSDILNWIASAYPDKQN
jgi:dsRNA-specific ribonuclease